mmetsp:Transcript_4831/g.17078  ORF Transcript_4831/g.17078 Transcript_4831/m.17078 type:complete len:248 (+) Transcript_4831:528-1271(+)
MPVPIAWMIGPGAGRGLTDMGGEVGLELTPRQLGGAQRRQVAGVLLAVDPRDAEFAAQADQRAQRDLGCIGAAHEHRLAEEHPAEVDAIEAADEFAVDPGLNAVHGRPGQVGGLQLGHDPGAVLAVARRAGAGPQHGGPVVVDANFAARRGGEALHRLAQRARQLEVRRLQHHARVGRPPQRRLAGAIPREDATPIGRLQARGRQRRARGEQPGRIGVAAQRTLAGREAEGGVVEPVDHAGMVSWRP